MQNNTLVKTAVSTPTAQQEGRVVTIKLAQLATYEINVRSFHPGKDFGWGGANFLGDSRGYSLKKSDVDGKAEVTSRIWHRFKLDTSVGKVLNPETEANSSGKAGSEAVKYDGLLKPLGNNKPMVRKEGKQIVTLVVEGGFAGQNHAFWLSSLFKKMTGGSYVPHLNVDYEIIITIDRVSKHMDIVTYIKGDGFPNCEAFITDYKGTSVFLGVHTRWGAALTQLWGNKGQPMVASAIRLGLDDYGNFSGMMGNELKRRKEGKKEMDYHPIEEWNKFFLELDPSSDRNMIIHQEPMPEKLRQRSNP